MTAGGASTGFDPARGYLEQVKERVTSPVGPYYLILGSGTLLLIFGLTMVLSASSVTSYASASHSSYTIFLNQASFAVVGVIGAFIASRMSVRFWKAIAFPVFFVAVFLQLLVFTPLGLTVNGNTNWIGAGGLTMQPSEVGKIAVVLLVATVLARKRRVLDSYRHLLLPLGPMLLLVLGAVLGGGDLGTSLVLLAIMGAMFFVAGVQLRIFGVAAGFAALGALAFALTSGNRTGRIDAWLGTCINAQTPGCWQKVHGMYAMADGGWWGVGLGASREKWFWLPEAHNDFIFAIIGEELGIPGTMAVVGLYVVLAYACYRLIVTSNDMFVRVATAGIMLWIVFQAMVNIGSVTGLLPIIGVPLPLVSAGGSALVTTLFALGMLLSFARAEPECRAALQARPSLLRKASAVLATSRVGR
ncbi:putative lipid II flippase FtsW [Allobranchiibius sp. CTAmp26]|uniref:putative lipid II flippase FtsW n=1 Tax=Allobranchiibius sp. CTAmp26 TaxID=2815214 RepID=UPI001AA195F5|nr:putative lipid II flippase FtsW [Allobranchiibius sp. CTAmp26]MBO1755257.1 putative lipid II flippase FtsW [Allobranchiibius sp. CTAmp26]